MRPGIVGAIAGIALGAVLAWSCSIERPSERLECSADVTCDTGRICQSGYCVVGQRPADARELDAAVCPAICNGGCDFGTTTCSIIGAGGNIVCPTAWNCSISCPSSGACGAINCGNAASCDIDCLADNACQTVQCLTKNCDVTCTGTNACGNISCTSGNCTASCTGSGSAVCGSLTCGTGDCTRTCSGSNACGPMMCQGTCTQTCSGGAAACGDQACGAGQCTATCQGLEPACGNVSCGNSCQCDVNCDGVTNTCPATMVCPDPGGPDDCTDVDRCDSSQNIQKCRTC